MRKIVLFIVVALLSLNCKKAIDKIKEDIVIQAMTDGQWIVTNYTKGNINITDDFNGYVFKFKKDKTVDAIKSGVTQKTGTWDGNAVNYTMSANFVNGTVPVIMLNGTWNLTNNSWTFVEATQTVNSEIRSIRLDKQ
jgi:hypothetical protein